MLTYSEQLRHPLWQRKRLRILERDGWMCVACCAADRSLHVHHRVYLKGRLAWEYDDSDLKTLCEDCHKVHHASALKVARAIDWMPSGELIALVDGFGAICLDDDALRSLHAKSAISAAGYIAAIASLLNVEDAVRVEQFVRSLLEAPASRTDDPRGTE